MLFNKLKTEKAPNGGTYETTEKAELEETVRQPVGTGQFRRSKGMHRTTLENMERVYDFLARHQDEIFSLREIAERVGIEGSENGIPATHRVIRMLESRGRIKIRRMGNRGSYYEVKQNGKHQPEPTRKARANTVTNKKAEKLVLDFVEKNTVHSQREISGGVGVHKEGPNDWAKRALRRLMDRGEIVCNKDGSYSVSNKTTPKPVEPQKAPRTAQDYNAPNKRTQELAWQFVKEKYLLQFTEWLAGGRNG